MIQIEWNPSRRQLRVFGLLLAIFCAALTTWLILTCSLLGFEFSLQSAHVTAFVLAAVGGASLLLSLTFPQALRVVYLTLNVITLPIGLVVSHVVLFVLYYIVLTPIGLVMRLLRRDPLARRFEPEAESYWQPAEPHPPAKRYFRQF